MMSFNDFKNKAVSSLLAAAMMFTTFATPVTVFATETDQTEASQSTSEDSGSLDSSAVENSSGMDSDNNSTEQSESMSDSDTVDVLSCEVETEEGSENAPPIFQVEVSTEDEFDASYSLSLDETTGKSLVKQVKSLDKTLQDEGLESGDSYGISLAISNEDDDEVEVDQR